MTHYAVHYFCNLLGDIHAYTILHEHFYTPSYSFIELLTNKSKNDYCGIFHVKEYLHTSGRGYYLTKYGIHNRVKNQEDVH